MTEIAKDYGTALFSLAQDEEHTDIYAEALCFINDLFEEHPAYTELLSCPNISKNERTALINDAFAQAVPPHVLSFLKLLSEHGHIRRFAACKAVYDALLDEDRKRSKATVRSAVPLTDGEKEKLIRKLEAISGRTVEALYEIDDSLLGGIVVTIGDTVYDGSLKRQIRNLKEVIAQ